MYTILKPPAVPSKSFATIATTTNKITSYANHDELTKIIKIITEQVSQLFAMFSKIIPGLKVSSMSNSSPPDVTPSASGLVQ